MATVTLTIEDVIASLEQVPPADLLGVKLLEKRKAEPGRWLPTNVPREQVVEAAKQIVEYSTQCQKLANTLANLEAAPSKHVVPEYGL